MDTHTRKQLEGKIIGCGLSILHSHLAVFSKAVLQKVIVSKEGHSFCMVHVCVIQYNDFCSTYVAVHVEYCSLYL